jgi:hypothetical protein
LINDNTAADSTQTALKEFAKGIIYSIKIEMRRNLAIQTILKNYRSGNRSSDLIAIG